MQEQQEDRMDGIDKPSSSHLSAQSLSAAVAVASQALAAGAPWARLPFQGKTRRGYTTNKGKGASKAKRKQALASRRRNRGK